MEFLILIIKFYTIILEKCEEEALHLIKKEEKSHCKTDKEIDELIGLNSKVYLSFIDNDIDMLNYKNPVYKYLYTKENSIQQWSYPINHLNFFPSINKTHNDLLFDNVIEKLSYFYDINTVYTHNDDTNNFYLVYYLWLNNRMHYYERTYKRIQEIISSIDGIYQFIFFLIFLNRLYNNDKVLIYTENLLNFSIYSENKSFHKIKKVPKNLDNLEKHPKSNNNTEIGKDNIRLYNLKTKNTNLKDKNLTHSSGFYIKNSIGNNIKSPRIQKQEKNKKDKKRRKS